MSQINWINKKEMDYLLNSEYKDVYPGLIDALNTPRFSISDLCVSHRDATYWDKKEILPVLQTKQTTRRKYTLKQAIWIKLIQQLRSFDISLNQIKKIKENILGQEIKMVDILQNEQVALILEQLVKEKGDLDQYKELLKDPEFHKSLEGEGFDLFETVILYTIIFRRDVSFIVTKEGHCFPYLFEKHQHFVKEVENFHLLMKQPHITLSLSQAYSQLILEWVEKDWFEDVSIVSKEERKILELLRDDRTEELQIFKRKNVPERVIQVRKNRAEAIEDFTNYIARNGYQKITINTRKGKVVNFKNEISLNIKDIPEVPDK